MENKIVNITFEKHKKGIWVSDQLMPLRFLTNDEIRNSSAQKLIDIIFRGVGKKE